MQHDEILKKNETQGPSKIVIRLKGRMVFKKEKFLSKFSTINCFFKIFFPLNVISQINNSQK